MANRRSPISLFELCIKKTSNHLEDGRWNGRNINPFSQISCNLVNELFKFLIKKNPENPNPLELLLKSGQLQDFVLDGIDFTKEQWGSVMKILLEEGDCCRNITRIMLPKSFKNDENASLERLIEKCPLLEILEVSTFFYLSALKNCARLKVVRNDLKGRDEYRYFRNESVDTLANLQNLKKFAIFECRNAASYYKHIAEVLQTHPNLVSLGLTDSSWAAHHINTACRFQTVPRFGLKECFWGFNRTVNRFDRIRRVAYTLQYSEFVKGSVALFPLVEKLIIIVHHINCLEHLKKLRHLRGLTINFNLCRGSPIRTAFISLLREIGPQLRHLTIMSRSTMPVDVVMKYCPNLVRLDVCCAAIVQGGIETDSRNFRQLKWLIVAGVDKESLEYLLRHCLNLKELLLYDAHCLDDILLSQILKMKSLSKIDTLGVKDCRLSGEGLKELVQRCVNLESVAFENLNATLMTVLTELRRDIRATHTAMASRLLAD